MVKLADLDVSDDHPLALEITSLRNTVARFQDEAHTTSIKLQRHSLDAAHAHGRLSFLERENDVLRKEIAVLRAHPHPGASQDAHHAASQIRELTLSMRILSDKLSQAEEALLTRTTELVHASNEAKKAKYAVDGAYQLVARMRHRDGEEMKKERELQGKLKATEERLRMTDSVVKEYGGLVRKLENKSAGSQVTNGRNSVSAAKDESLEATSSYSGASLFHSFEEGKFGLQRLLSEFCGESERQQAEIERLQGELAMSKTQLQAQNLSIEEERVELAKTLAELQKLKMDDNTAAKMVSRYMTFSQASSNSLQTALSSVKARHAATIDTLSTQISLLTTQLQDAKATVERLRAALDELGGDYMKESYGRRREVALRIKLLNREEGLMESIRRWLLRSQEALEKAPNAPAPESLARMVDEAKSILLSNDGPLHDPPSGSLARILAAHTAADSLAKELHAETGRRLELQRMVAFGREEEPEPATGTSMESHREIGTQSQVSTLSIGIQASMLQETKPSAIKGPEAIIGTRTNDYRESSTQHEILSLNVGIQVSTPQEATPSVTLSANVGSTASIQHQPRAGSSDIIGNPPVVGSLKKATNGPTIQPGSTITAYEATPLATQLAIKGEDVEVSSISHSPQNGQVEEAVMASESCQRPSSVEPSAISPENGHPAALADEEFPTSLTSTKANVPEIVVAHADGKPQPLLLLVEDQQGSEHESEAHQGMVPPTTLQDTINVEPGTQDDNTAHPSPLNLPELLPSSQHPLLVQLAQIGHRYDEMQRAFHDCHFALDELKKSPPTSSSSQSIPLDALKLALERLDDYVEDARVELEIRVADESVLARGYETLLSVSGVMALPTSTVANGSSLPPEIQSEIEAFVQGTDASIQKAQDSLMNKLSDIRHDIALLKRVIHDQEDPPTESPQHSPSFTPLLGSMPASAPAANEVNSGWKSWFRRSSSRPSSPALTFGDMTTSSQLRHSPSFNFASSPVAGRTPRKPYLFSDDASRDPLASLGFRVPMPQYVNPKPIPSVHRGPSMYLVGLGARAASGSLSPLMPPPHQIAEQEPTTADTEKSIEGDLSDIE